MENFLSLIFIILTLISSGQDSANSETSQFLNIKLKHEKKIKILTDSLSKINEIIEEHERKIELQNIQELDTQHYIEIVTHTDLRVFDTSTYDKVVGIINPGEKMRLFGYDYHQNAWYVRKDTLVGYIFGLFVKQTDAVDSFKNILTKRMIDSEFSKLSKEIKKQKKEDSIKIAKENDVMNASKQKIIIIGVEVTDINSANGVSFCIKWKYYDTSKTIKYIYFTVLPFNAVGDIVSCNIRNNSIFTGKVTGPLEAEYESREFHWENAWYNNTISCIKITKIKIEYMDGYSYTYINELPNLFAPQFSNKCNVKSN